VSVGPRSPEADRAHIHEVVLRYCRGVDRLDLDLVRSAYHLDGIDHHTGFDGDVEHYLDWVRTALRRFSGTMHIVGNHLTELHGDQAISETYGTAVHWGEPADSPQHNFTSGFRYVDLMSYREGRWAISERWAVREWTRSDAGRQLPKEGVGPSGSRDAADPLAVLRARFATAPDHPAQRPPAQRAPAPAPAPEDRIADLEQRLREVEDHLALTRIIASYGPAVDSGSAGTTARLWTETGVYDTFPVVLSGRQELRGMVTGEMHQGLINAGAAHLMGPPHIVVDGDHAVVTHYSQLVLRDPPADGYRIWRTGVNRWEFARTDQGWQATSRVNRQLDGSEEARNLLAQAVRHEEL